MTDETANNLDAVPLPEHLAIPHLRRLMPQGVSKGNQQGVALRDPLGLAQRTMVVAPPVMQVLQQFNGEQPLEEIAQKASAPLEELTKLVNSLDEVGLLWGPTCTQLEQDRLAALHDDGVLPLRQGSMLGETAEAARECIAGWLTETEDPEVEFPVRGLLAPRLDHQVVWPIYAALYHAARATGADRVLVLGNNHYGIGDGVTLTRCGFQSPMGRLACDTAMVDALVKRLGDVILKDELDHMADHGIEMQVPWISETLGDIPIVGALLPDPMTPPIDDDEEARCTPESFIDAVREVIDTLDGNTLVVATGDLSHVGPRFGEPRPVDEERQVEVEQHDREFLATILSGDLEAIDGAIKWHNNPTRWSCLGAAQAMIGIVQPTEMELIDYRQQLVDQDNSSMLTAAGVAAGGA